MSIGDAISVGSTIYGILSPPIFRQCGYILFCSSHVSDLKSEIQKLKDAAARLQHSVDESRSAGEFIHEDVLMWLNNADQRIEAGNRILEINKVGRVLGCVPDPKACHKLGRNAKKAIPDFQKLFSEGVFDKVSYHRIEEQSLIVGASTSSHQRNYVALKSRTAVLKFVMEALDDDKIGAIGVYGMGGVGKTTLLKEVENGARESKKFDGVLNLFVSQTPNLTAIRSEIDYRLKRLISSDTSRKTILILFDDLWKPLDLKDLGVPESNNKLKVKLVMTSRNKHLLANEMSCQRTFSIGVLDMEEAWRFFAVLVSSKIQDLKGKPAAVAFLKKCAGLPVSIEALATLWKKKKMDSSYGDLSEDDLKQARESPDGFVSLELSYNSVEDGDQENQAKLVFRIIGLLNSPKVPVLTLIKYMVGLGLFGSSTSYNIVEKARMEITRSLRTLQESSLLLESEDSDHVKIHDVVRDVAVGIASREDHALIFDPLKGTKEWTVENLKECKAASFTSSVLKELHEGCNFQELNIFVLEAGVEQGDHHVELPDARDMVKLRVMQIKNAQFTSLPSSINPDLTNLTTLCLENCCLEDIAVIGKLITLQVLSITGSDLAKLPEEIGELTNLRMLDLSKCSQLVFIKPGVLERLTQLEELYLRESFNKWEIEGDNGGKHNASLEELNGMPRLRTLEVHIPDTSKLPQNLPIGDLVQCKVLMGESWDWSGEYNKSRTLKLEVKLYSMITEEWFQSALQKTQDLHLKGLNGTTESFHELCREGFEELKHLHLQNSSSIKCIIWSTKWLECSAFTTLESMILEKMEGLENICKGRISSSSFSKLKVVRVQECNKLRSIFNLSLLQNLTELEEMEISDCYMVQQILIAEHINDDATGCEEHNVATSGCSNIFFGRHTKRPTKDVEEDGADDGIKLLGKLRYLRLINLPEMTSFCTTQVGPRDESIETTVVPAAFFNDQKVSQALRYKEIQSATRLGLNKLQRIELTECKNVVHFTNFQVLLKLVNLESLSIEGCESLEDIFDLQGIEPDVEILPNLYELKLRELPKLEYIWKKNLNKQIKGCRKLRTIEIYKCNTLLYLSSSFMCEGMESLTEINVGHCKMMEAVFLEEEGPAGSNASSSPVKAWLSSLKILVISNCSKLKTFLLDSKCQTVSTSIKTVTCWCYETKAVEDTSNQVDSSNSFFNQKAFLPSLESLILTSAGGFKKLWCGEIPDQSYCKLEYVHLESCEHLVTVFPASLVERLHNLKQLWVIDCWVVKTVIDIDVGWKKSKKKSTALTLPHLHEMKLEKLSCLTHILGMGDSDDELVIGFPSLSLLSVQDCYWLTNLIPTTTATTLLKLKSLTVYKCVQLQKVISGEVGDHRDKRNAITFPHLTSLSLINLEKLICFSSESYRFDFTCLKDLYIRACKPLKTFIQPIPVDSLLRSEDEYQGNTAKHVLFNDKVQLPNLEKLSILESQVEELWGNEPSTSSSFCKLKFLEVQVCSALQNIIPPFMEKRLQNLEIMSILGCDSLQDIFEITSTSQVAERRIINFAKLTSLTLGARLKLNNLWSGSYTLELPSLKTLFFYKTDATAVQAIMEKVHLPNLEELKVESVETTELWHNEPSVGSFSKLKILGVDKCGALVKIIPMFMVKRLEHLEELEVKSCSNLAIVSELKWSVDVQDSETSKLLPCSPFQNLVQIIVEKCERLRNLFSISEQQHIDDSDDKIVQLPQLTYLVLMELPNFNHLLFQQAEQYILELSSLAGLCLVDAGDKEVVTHKVAFPEELEIQVSDMSNFFGSISSVVTVVVKAIQNNQDNIIGLLGYMGEDMILELKHRVSEEEANLFDQVVDCWGTADRIQAELGNGLGMVYGEADVQGRAERVGKNMLTYTRNKRLLLIFSEIKDEGIIEASGIPVDGGGVDPKHFKIILISHEEELVLKMGAKLTIPIGNDIGDRWNIFDSELVHLREAFLQQQEELLPAFDDTNTDPDICSFIAPNTLLFNNFMNALCSHQNNDQVIIGLFQPGNCSYADLWNQVRFLKILFHAYVYPDDEEVETIQESLETALGLITSSSSETTASTGLRHENRAQCIRQTLLSNDDQDKRLLLTLDLFEKVDLEAVGIPLIDELDPKFFKMFLTCNDRDVLQKMGAQQIFEFKREIMEDCKFCRILDGYVEKAELVKLAEECGSDDLIKRLANKLKTRGLLAWAKAFRRLKESPFTYEERKKVIDSL